MTGSNNGGSCSLTTLAKTKIRGQRVKQIFAGRLQSDAIEPGFQGLGALSLHLNRMNEVSR
jgi:hypothetical protein